MTFVATDENLACDHSHDAAVGITTATDGTCAVHLYLHHRDVFEQMYGVSPIGRWDTSQVTDMSYLFCADTSSSSGLDTPRRLIYAQARLFHKSSGARHRCGRRRRDERRRECEASQDPHRNARQYRCQNPRV